MAEEESTIEFAQPNEGLLYFNPGRHWVTFRKAGMEIHYYYKPNWYERLHWWLSGYKGEWHDESNGDPELGA